MRRRGSLITMLGTAMFGVMTISFSAPPALAQRGFPAPHFAFNRGHAANSPFGRGSSFLYPLALPLDNYYDDYYAEALNAGYPVASQPPVVILQALPVVAPPTETHTGGEPVLIELLGDTYVRVTGPPASGAATLNLTPSHPDASVELSAQARAVQPAPAPHKGVVLVFRDGHREDVSDYVIANGTLYAHTNYYTTGAWTKAIELVALDLPETVSSNQSRGVSFQLPNAANEVIVGP